jgi:hypothetical protein
MSGIAKSTQERNASLLEGEDASSQLLQLFGMPTAVSYSRTVSLAISKVSASPETTDSIVTESTEKSNQRRDWHPHLQHASNPTNQSIGTPIASDKSNHNYKPSQSAYLVHVVETCATLMNDARWEGLFSWNRGDHLSAVVDNVNHVSNQ